MIEERANLVESSSLNAINNLLEIEPPSRGLQGSTTPLVPPVDHLRGELDGLRGVEPSVASNHPVDLANTIKLPQAHHEFP